VAARRRRWIAKGIVAVVLVACGVVIAAILGLFLGSGNQNALAARFMLKPDDIIVERRPDPAYDQLFPYYVELCAISQWSSKTGRQGGVTGHAVMYLKGACKDEDAPFPQLRRCHYPATAFDDPEHGAGVSVNRWLRNVNWLAIPGYKLFYEGTLEPGERLTQAEFDATVRAAIDAGVFDGVELHDYPTTAAERSLEDFVANRSIVTDFALRFGRTVSCARVPVSAPMLGEIIAFLNDKNLEYATGEADYNWHLLADNCVHTLRNALAAASVWSPLSVREVKLRHLLNLAVPANEFVNLAQLGTGGEIADPRRIHAEDELRDALLDFGWLPTRHGALLKTLPVHAPNDMFDATFRLFTLQSPLRIGKTNEAIRLLSDTRFVVLKANLEHFRDKYDAILAGQDARARGLASVRGDPDRRIERVHHDYIQAQRAEVALMLERLAELEGPPDRPPSPKGGSADATP
jgi:hypothetical protein